MSADFFEGAAARLPDRVAVYVPGTDGPADADAELAAEMTAATAEALADLFGGATIQDAAGAWVSAAHGLIQEAVKIVYAFAPDGELERRAPEIRRIVETVKNRMRQEAVSVEINGALYLV